MINAAVANKPAEGISQSTAGADLLAKSSGGWGRAVVAHLTSAAQTALPAL